MTEGSASWVSLRLSRERARGERQMAWARRQLAHARRHNCIELPTPEEVALFLERLAGCARVPSREASTR